MVCWINLIAALDLNDLLADVIDIPQGGLLGQTRAESVEAKGRNGNGAAHLKTRMNPTPLYKPE